MPKKQEPEFIDRIMNPEKYPFIENEDGTFSTHRMANTEVDGRFIAFPMIQFIPFSNELYEFKDFRNAVDYALRTGNFKEFNSDDEALAYAKNYKTGTPLADFNPRK
jgi:hypothetical protein